MSGVSSIFLYYLPFVVFTILASEQSRICNHIKANAAKTVVKPCT